jgi:DNA-binding Lrp family transcriptional regulator
MGVNGAAGYPAHHGGHAILPAAPDIAMIDETALYQRLRQDFPLEPRPYRCLARALGLSEHGLLSLLARDVGSGRISHVGARFAALSVPAARLESVARRLNADPAIGHHYCRTGHRYNLWFVAGARDADHLATVLDGIGADVHQTPLALPLECEYHVDAGVPLRPLMTDADWRLVAALEDGLPLTPEPYHAMARGTGIGLHELWRRLAHWREAGVIRRFGAILQPGQLGFVHNAMCVWNAPDARVDVLGKRLARLPAVALCYRRARRGAAWPFNLFAVVRARSAADLQATLDGFTAMPALANLPGAVLRARCCFKPRGVRYGDLAPEA